MYVVHSFGFCYIDTVNNDVISHQLYATVTVAQA